MMRPAATLGRGRRRAAELYEGAAAELDKGAAAELDEGTAAAALGSKRPKRGEENQRDKPVHELRSIPAFPSAWLRGPFLHPSGQAEEPIQGTKPKFAWCM